MARTKYIRNTYSTAGEKKDWLFYSFIFFPSQHTDAKIYLWSKIPLSRNPNFRATVEILAIFFLEFFQQIVLFWFIVRNIQMYWLMYRLKWNMYINIFFPTKGNSRSEGFYGFYQFCRFSARCIIAFESMSSSVSSADTSSFTFFLWKTSSYEKLS